MNTLFDVGDRDCDGDETLERASRQPCLVRRPQFPEAPRLPAGGRYELIYCDPPWLYKKGTTVPGKTVEAQYPTMTLADICALPVGDLAAKNCLLAMWTTAPKLEEAFEVVSAWGFEYQTNGVWIKPPLGMGHRLRINHEHLLFATKGKPEQPPDHLIPWSVFSFKKGKHSEKPKEFYEILETAYPRMSKIELFARGHARKGWDAWGNQALPEPKNVASAD